MDRDQIIAGDPGSGDGLFGDDCAADAATAVIVPVPWEMTVSYGRGTCGGPDAVHRASGQLDVFDTTFGIPLLRGIALLPPDPEIVSANNAGVPLAEEVIAAAESGGTGEHKHLARCNDLSAIVNQRVDDVCSEWIDKGKIVGVLGGDHSSPLGLMRSLDRRHADGFGIVHFDAHLDLRFQYEGFHYSHASIMRNALTECPNIKKIVGIGMRDFCKHEYDFASSYDSRYEAWYDRDVYAATRGGGRFAEELARRISDLPDKVYLSFDIDGLDPSLCPGTGTPVPGGLSFNEACFIIETVAKTGREIIGFDLCEVGPNEWDANVGARILYKLAGASIYSRHGYTS